MRILFVTPGYPPDIGGIENVVKELSERMSDSGNQIYVLATSKKKIGVERISEHLTIERVRAISPNNAYHYPIGLGKRLRALRGQFDIIHAHGYHSLPALVSYLNRGKTPFVISCHYHRHSHKLFRNILLKPYKLLAKKMINGSRCVFCVSKAEESLVKEDFLPVRCEVIHNGVSAQRFNDNERNNEDRIVMIGRLERYKNQELGIEFIKVNPQYKLEIIGDGPDFGRLRKIVESEGIGDRVSFHRGISEGDKNRILAKCSVLFSLSNHESFGLVILEAVSRGIPVIASDIPSHREIYDALKCGVNLVDQNDLEKISLAVKNIDLWKGDLENKNIEKFHWGEITVRYLEAYESLMASGEEK